MNTQSNIQETITTLNLQGQNSDKNTDTYPHTSKYHLAMMQVLMNILQRNLAVIVIHL